MVPTLLSAAITCVCSLFLGQAALRLAGAREWSWLAPPVGVSIVMLIAVPAIHVPGRSTTVAVIVIVLTVLSILWCGSSSAHRPPVKDLLTVLPLGVLVLIPSAAAGTDVHDGIVTVTGERLYSLVSLPRAQRMRLSLRFAPGLSGYSFTFG